VYDNAWMYYELRPVMTVQRTVRTAHRMLTFVPHHTVVWTGYSVTF